MAVETRSIQNKAKQQDHAEGTNEVSNSQLQEETLICSGQRKEKAEEPKHSNRSVELKRTQQSNYNENKTLYRKGTAEN